jgi:hypothetical protein
MSSYLLSILLPPQKRFETLKNIIQNITDNLKDINSVEIILKITENDVEGYLPQISDLLNLTPHIKILISDNTKEDTSVLNSINQQNLIADGEFLLLLNNGILFNLSNLDSMVKKYQGKLCVIEGKNNLSFTSPLIVHHKIVEILGLQSLFNSMCSDFGIEIKEPNISYNCEESKIGKYNFNWEKDNKMNELKSYIDTLEWSREWLPLIT